MIKFKNKTLYILGIIILFVILLITYHITKNNKYTIKNYKNDYYSFRYDTSWNIYDQNSITYLYHKNDKGKISVTYKKLDTYLIDVKLKDIISDVIYEIEKQNKDYKLVNKNARDDGSYELFYESDSEECLVYIYKQDTMLVFVYYNADSKYFDLTMDSYDLIIDSLKVFSGEKME